MGIIVDIDEKVLSELKLLVQIGAKPVECVRALEGKMSRSSVYKYHKKLKDEMDSELTGAFEEVKAINVPNKVAEESFGENKEADSIYQDGQIIDFNGKKIKFVHTGTTSIDECYKCCLEDECCDCMDSRGYWTDAEIKEQVTEEQTETLNEIAAKNEELQKELHTSKNVITTLQKGVNELNEAITESKIAIAEVCKERDDGAEEIRVLRLELQKYKNDLNSVLDDRQKLECLLSDNVNAVELNPKYDSLYKVFLMAYNQASNGKGKERHANDEDFRNQKIVTLNKQIGSNHGAIFQACKKAQESARLSDDRAIAELLGAINYLAAAVIILQEEK